MVLSIHINQISKHQQLPCDYDVETMKKKQTQQNKTKTNKQTNKQTQKQKQTKTKTKEWENLFLTRKILGTSDFHQVCGKITLERINIKK